MKKREAAVVCGLMLLAAGLSVSALKDPQRKEAARPLTLHQVKPGVFTIAVLGSADPTTFDELARRTCGDLDPCTVGIWIEQAAPKALPFSAQQVAAQRFSYQSDRARGVNSTTWNCSAYPTTPMPACMEPIERELPSPLQAFLKGIGVQP